MSQISLDQPFTADPQPDSGTVIDNQSTYNHSFVMDNLRITPVPEPETYALSLAGLVLMAGMARRKRQAA